MIRRSWKQTILFSIPMMMGLGFITTPIFADEVEQPVVDELDTTSTSEVSSMGNQEQQILSTLSAETFGMDNEVDTNESVVVEEMYTTRAADDNVQPTTDSVQTRVASNNTSTPKYISTNTNKYEVVIDTNKQSALGFYQSLGNKGGTSTKVFSKQALNNKTNKPTQKYVNSNYTKLSFPDDATSLNNFRKAITFLKTTNNLRKAEGKKELLVSPTLMAITMMDTNMISKSMNHEHSYMYSAGGQNAAWGYSNPYEGWYTKEKNLYLKGERNTTLVGHYLNLINGSYTVMGTGYNRRSSYGSTSVQNFMKSDEYHDAMSVAEFERLFINYYNKHYVPKLNDSYTGLVKATDKNWYYFSKGTFKGNFTGVSSSKVSKKLFAVRNGKLDWKYTGILKNYNNGKWYFVRKGVHDNKFTGVAKSATNGKWYHVNKGILNWKFTGLSKSVSNGKYYFSRKGQLDWKFTGLAKSISNGKWYFARKGQLDWKFTGIAKSVQDGKYYFVRKGKLNLNFTGISKSATDGKWYFTRKGKLDTTFTGVAKSVADGKWYHVTKGKLNWKYTGASKSVANGKYYYVTKGRLNWNYNGYVRIGNRVRVVRKGKVL